MSASQTKGISILLVDDHPVVRQGYRRVLENQSDFRVVAEAENAATAYRAFKTHAPDIVVMDISMPGIGGVEAIRHIRQWDSAARILVFTMHQSAAYAIQAIKAGARGFVTKSSPPDTLLRAIGEVMAGRRPGRTDDRQITLFDSTGMGLQDVAAAAAIYRRALATGAGARLDL